MESPAQRGSSASIRIRDPLPPQWSISIVSSGLRYNIVV